MSERISQKRVSVSFSKDDYEFLYSVYESCLFSGKSRVPSWQLNDVLKAIALSASIDLMMADIELANLRLTPFFINHGTDISKLPKNINDIISKLKNYYHNNLWTERSFHPSQIPWNEKINIESDLKGGEEFPHGENPHVPEKTINFTVSLTEKEFEWFDSVRILIESFVSDDVSLPEIIRTFFRSVLNPSPLNDLSKAARTRVLSSLYIGSLYDFSPLDSILIFSRLDNVDNITISKESLDALKWIGNDEIYFNLYKEEMEKELDEQKSLLKSRKQSYIIPGFELEHLGKNKERDDKFRAPFPIFGFHSAFIGFFFVIAEWEFDQHKIPLLAPYLTGRVYVNRNKKNETYMEMGHYFSTVVFSDIFVPYMHVLYKYSRFYRAHGKLRLDKE